jgi:prepilin-type N-terminal cleavage/methylation domain-containing protein
MSHREVGGKEVGPLVYNRVNHGVADREVTLRQCKGGDNLCDDEVVYGFIFRKVKEMRKNKGFTLIELMVVILIVAILAAVLAPLMTGRINAAKWTEGKAGAGTIVTAIRAFVAEHEGTFTAAEIGTLSGAGGFANVGITDADLAGKYFQASNYVATYSLTGSALTGIVVTVTPTAALGLTPASQVLTVTLPVAAGPATSVWTTP